VIATARHERLELLGSLAVLLLAAVALLADALFSSRVLSAADALLQFEPWRSAAPGAGSPANPLLLDQPTVCEPWLDLAAEQLRAGELPLWNPYNYSGQPYHAAASGGFASPLNWLYFQFPGHATKEWSALLRLFLAGAFALFWLRCFALSAYARLLGALCFQLGGFMVAWLGHPHTAAALFLPFLLWRIERGMSGSAARAIGTLGLGSGLAWLSGHAQTALHVALFTALYATWRGAQQRMLARSVGICGTGLVLGGLVGLVQLWPQWEYVRASQAALLFDEFDVTSPFGLGDALRFLVAPFATGAPHHGDYTGPLGHNLNYAELVGGYVGVLPLLLACAALTRARAAPGVRVLAGLGAIALLVAWQVAPFYDVARAVPVLASTKLLRLLLVVNLALAALAAFGLDAVLERIGSGARVRVLWAAGAVLLVLVDLLAIGRGFNPSIEPARIAPETPVTRFLREQSQPYRVLAVDNTAFAPSANLFQRIPVVSGYDSVEDQHYVALVSLLSKDPAAGLREFGDQAALPPTSFVKEIRAFDRLEALPVAALLNVRYVLSSEPLPAPFELRIDGSTRLYEYPSAMPRAYATCAYHWVDPPRRSERGWIELDGSRLPDPLNVELERPPGVAPEPSGAADAGGAICEIRSYSAQAVEIEVRAQSACCVVLSDAYADGWEATLDGSPVRIERAFGALRAVLCPAGEHVIEMRYAPHSVRLGLWASVAGVLFCVALSLVKRRTPAAGIEA